MKCFLVHFIPASVELAKSGALVGKLHVELEGKSFPDSEWSDFLVIIAHWMKAASRLKSRASQSATLGFMDGPFEILLTKMSDEMVAITPRDRRGKGASDVSVAKVDIDTVLDELRRTAVAITTSCSKRGIKASDLLEIARELKKTPDSDVRRK